MRAEFGEQSPGILFVQPPVNQALELDIAALRNRTPPTVVSVPVGIDLRNLPELSRLNAAQHLPVPWRIVILQADLKMLAGTFYFIHDAVALLDSERQALLGVNVPSTLQDGN